MSRRGAPQRSIPVGLPPFQRLLDDHGRDVYRFLAATVGPAEAEDCFQEAFLAALRAYPRVRDGSRLRSWLFTIAYHKAVDAHRARARRPVAVATLPEGAGPVEDGAEPELWRHVRRLPPKQRAAVVQRFVNDLPYAEIGEALGCSEEAARRNVSQGVKKLREVWDGR